MTDLPPGWGAPLAQLAEGAISPEIALTLLLLASSELDPPRRLAALSAADANNWRLASLARLADRHRPQLERIRALVASGIDPAEANDPAARIAATRAHFDRLAGEAPEAAVALYSFGDPGLLAAATAELIEVIAFWTELCDKAVLDFGCGIGRVAAALAPLVGQVVGVDLSEAMVAEARRRTAGIPNLSFEPSDGVDLAQFADGSFDLVLAIDSLPYLVRAGEKVVRSKLAEFERLLRSDGELIVFNWSYRGDLGRDTADARAFGSVAGFDLLRAAEQPLRIWNGAGFHFRRL